MRAPRMQKLHVVFLACGAVNGDVNGTSALSSAYLICTVRVRKSFRLLWNRDLPYGTLVVSENLLIMYSKIENLAAPAGLRDVRAATCEPLQRRAKSSRAKAKLT